MKSGRDAGSGTQRCALTFFSLSAIGHDASLAVVSPFLIFMRDVQGFSGSTISSNVFCVTTPCRLVLHLTTIERSMPTVPGSFPGSPCFKKHV